MTGSTSAGAKVYEEHDIEQGGDGGERVYGEREASHRIGFLRKVYGLLLSQMVLTCAIVWYFSYLDGPRHWMLGFAQSWAMVGLIVVNLTCLIALICCFQHTYPINLVLLFVVTALNSMSVAATVARFAEAGMADIVFQAALLTVGLFTFLTTVACTTKQDLSWMQVWLGAGLVVICLWSFTAMLFGFKLGMIYALCGILLFSGFLVYDTWEAKHIASEDDYIVVTIGLYLDIINLFMFILRALSSDE